MSEVLFSWCFAASQVVGLRGVIRLALLVYELPFWQVIFLSVTGHMVPVLLLPFLGVITSVLSQRFSLLEQYFTWLFLRTRRKHKGKFETLQDFALVAFVAIPLPFTGVWTAMIAAFVFGIPLRRAFPLILIGVIMAAAIVSRLTIALR